MFPKKNPTAHTVVVLWIVANGGVGTGRKFQELLNPSPILLREGFRFFFCTEEEDKACLPHGTEVEEVCL